MPKLDGKLAVITGGNSGIGLATTRLFVEEGAHVVVAGRSEETLAQVRAEFGSCVRTVQGDQNLAEVRKATIDAALEFGGGIDVLFANAGGGQPATVDQITEESVDWTMNLNFRSPLLLITEALPHVRENGSILVTTSVLSQVAMPGMSLYSAAKAALASAVRGLAVELAPRGIRVNSIAPGPIQTPIFGRIGLSPEQVDAFVGNVKNSVPLSRLGKPEEIAEVALLLATAGGGFITGTELLVDGGMLAQ